MQSFLVLPVRGYGYSLYGGPKNAKKDSAMQLVTALQNPLLFAEIVMKFEP